ncbi:MAG: hypothetical protein Q8O91_02930 [Candidatus Aminicenantes bacterium]|nr:hypothetical protein [Candidatus Aminicenantes bacterium]
MTDFSESIPKKILDWQATGRDMTYDRKTLFNYMDGGAEVYLAFDFKQAFVRKYQGPAKDEIALDIYDMGSANEAFGIFSCDRQDPGVGIGQESEYGPGLLRFHQGRYFVSITAAGDEKKAEKAILKLGKAVAPLLGPAGPLPALLRCLPETGLKKDRTSYFHSALNLNNRFFVSGDNILNLDLRTDCILSDYALSAAETAHLLIVRYPDESRAQAAYRSFCQAYLPQGATSGAAQAEDRTWTVAVVRTDFVAVVFKAPTKQYAERLLSAVRYLQP